MAGVTPGYSECIHHTLKKIKHKRIFEFLTQTLLIWNNVADKIKKLLLNSIKILFFESQILSSHKTT